MAGGRGSRRWRHRLANLNLAQRLVIIGALGAVGLAIDGFVSARTSDWFGYAPNTSVVFDPDGGTRTKVLVVRVALAVAWAAAGVVILRSPKK